MKQLQRLYAKGWTEKELAVLDHHLKVAESRKTSLRVFAERSMYWFYLLCIALAIVAFAQVFFPLLSYLHPVVANLTVAFVAGCVAALFGHVLHDLDELERGHHLLVLLVATVAAIASAWLTIARSLRLGVLFAIVFILLYSYYWYRSHEKHKFA